MARYAEPKDIVRFALPAAALETVPLADQEAALDAASAQADDALRVAHALPLAAPHPLSLRRAVAIMAGYDLLTSGIGFNPEGFDEVLERKYERVLAWLDQVADGDRSLHATDATPGVAEGGLYVDSDEPRGL